MLAEYHDIFSLESWELGCTDLAKHDIRVVDDEPFKERLWRIPPLMLDEVHALVKEMLEVGTIHPVKAHCVMQLCCVYKKDGGMHTFALTYVSSMPELRKTPINFLKYRKP